MGRIDCEQARDLVPLLIRGQLLPPDAEASEAHLLECGECRVEADIVRTVAVSEARVPAGLEARVLLAVRRPARRTWSPSRVAMAATLAATVLGGSVIFERWAGQGVLEPAGSTVVFEDSQPATMSWAVGDDPLLQSGATLVGLSMEELELVLQELDS